LLVPTPSEVHNVPRWMADHGLADPVNMRIGEGDRLDLAVHMAAVACLSASRHHRAMTMMTPEQVCHIDNTQGEVNYRQNKI